MARLERGSCGEGASMLSAGDHAYATPALLSFLADGSSLPTTLKPSSFSLDWPVRHVGHERIDNLHKVKRSAYLACNWDNTEASLLQVAWVCVGAGRQRMHLCVPQTRLANSFNTPMGRVTFIEKVLQLGFQIGMEILANAKTIIGNISEQI